VILPSLVSASRITNTRRSPAVTLVDTQPRTKFSAVGPIELKTPAHQTATRLIEVAAACQLAHATPTLSDEQLLSLP